MPMGMPYPKGEMSMSKMMGVESKKDAMPAKKAKSMKPSSKNGKKMTAKMMMKGKC